ncbi:bacterial Ig-like domain-containing protein [Alkaliphilus crotonatoxidans]
MIRFRGILSLMMVLVLLLANMPIMALAADQDPDDSLIQEVSPLEAELPQEQGDTAPEDEESQEAEGPVEEELPRETEEAVEEGEIPTPEEVLLPDEDQANLELEALENNIDIHQHMTKILSDWQFSAFGSNTSTERNPKPMENEDGSITIGATGGKIASGDEGISFLYQELPSETNFQLTVQVTVNSFNNTATISTPNQKSFGLMVRNEVGEDGDSAVQTSSYAAVGALDTVMKGFYKAQGTQTKLPPYEGINAPTADEVYSLSLRKSGSTYVFTCNGISEAVTLEGLLDETAYVGLFVARDAEITFSDFDITIDQRRVTELSLDYSQMKTEYLVGETLDTTGLIVKALYSDGTEEALNSDDYIVMGYDSSEAGQVVISIHYNGAIATIKLTIISLSITSLDILYHPAKTTYYPGDSIEIQGLTVLATYNHGYYQEELEREQYRLLIDGQPIDEASYTFDTPGEKIITVQAIDTPVVTVDFTVTVVNAQITELEIIRMPEKTLYFPGEELKLEGMIVYAKYSDNRSVRLSRSEYTVSALDTTTTGEKEITIFHKGTTVSFKVLVKERELVGIEVRSYPKTTYYLGEVFDSTGLVVVKAYDNGEKEVLEKDQYQIDLGKYDSSQAGIYDIKILPADESIEPIILKVTVQQAPSHEWQFIRFGQSSSDSRNYGTVRADGTIELVALEGGGKVTGDHDGITFYYTEIDAGSDNFTLSADIKVIEYAKTPHDGQESFGIMARDAVGPHGDASVFASNIAAVGGYSGGTRNDNGTQFFIRTGVESPDGAGSQGIKSIMLKEERPQESNTYPQAPYRLTLSKTNSGYTASLNDGETAIFYEPELLNVMDGKIYVGFYAARLATIEVSNVELSVTAAITDAPRVEPPKVPVEPDFEFLSLEQTASTNYELLLKSNVKGYLTLKMGHKTLIEDQALDSNEIFKVSTEIGKNRTTGFIATFIPDDTALLTSYDKIIKHFTVENRSYDIGENIYVSPTGTGNGTGTADDPLDLDTAIAFLKPGQKIVLMDGRYVRNAKLEIKKYNDGTADAMKYMVAAPGARPIIDFDKKTEGVVLSGNYWHVKGIDFIRSAGNTKGFTIGGSHNIVELCRFYENGDTGLQISRTDLSNDISQWPSYNLILNSTAFDNRDPSDNNADGFAAKLTAGVGNVFRGCIAHNNIDDGWDLYTKAGTGAIGPVIIEDSIAYHNGFLTDGTVGAGDKNGFKLGGEGIHVPHIIRNSMAFGNGAYGFTSNSNPGVIAENNIGFNNEGANLSFTTYTNIPTDFTIKGFVSYQKDYRAKDQYPAHLSSNDNFMFDGTSSKNQTGVVLTDQNFESLMPTIPYERDEAGNIIWGDFLKFIAPRQNQTDDSGRGDSRDGSEDRDTTRPRPRATTPSDSQEDTSPATEKTSILENAQGVQLTREKVPYISGYPDGTIKPNHSMTREEAIALIYQLIINEDKGNYQLPQGVLTDVDRSSWSTEAVAYLFNQGMIKGYADGTLKPKKDITRAEFIAMMASFIPDDATAGIVSFTDIQGSWSRELVERAAAAGWIQGYGDGTFRPNQGITRAEAITMMNRILNRIPDYPYIDQTGAAFSDLSPDHWAYYEIMEAVGR